MCNSCNDRSGNCNSIIWIILIYFLLGDNCGCDNGCGRSTNSCSYIWILLLLFCCGGNGGFLSSCNDCGCERHSCGCDRPTPCGCN